MDAKELRIGNLVTDQFYESFKTVIEVESVNDKGINLQICDDGNYPECAKIWIEPEYKFNDLNPIPLTEEWLIKFGLIKLRSPMLSFVLGCYEICFNPISEDYSVILKGGVICTLKYVHQLQNLYFALTGKELELKEDK